MIELIKQLLQHPAGSFGFIFSFLTLAFFLVHWITKKITIINNSHSVLSNTIEKIEKKIDSIECNLHYINGGLDLIKENLYDFKKSNSNIAKSKSPISLTDYGLELAEKLNAKDMVCRNWDLIYKDLETNIKDKNPYDIQEYCMFNSFVGLEKFICESDILLLKKIAFEQGKSIQYYSEIFGILIRDKYFELKGIDVLDVDKHNTESN